MKTKPFHELFESFKKTYAKRSYSYCDPDLKLKMHRSGIKLLRALAADLCVPEDAYDVSSNKAGIACSGEITLHTDDLYVQILESCVGPGGLSALVRGCMGRKDYHGLCNRFIGLSDAQPAAVLHLCRQARLDSANARNRRANATPATA
jgi:hypothetical protein